MMADCDMVASQTDQVGLYYRHNFDIGTYFGSFALEKFRSEPEFVGIFKKIEVVPLILVIYIQEWIINQLRVALCSLNLFLDKR